MRLRIASSSPVKVQGVRLGAIAAGWPLDAKLLLLPVELQAAVTDVNAQPVGESEILGYARLRHEAMCRLHGSPAISDLDFAIESGACGNSDVAMVGLHTSNGLEVIELSEAVPFPPGTLDLARQRGLKQTTVGDIIHEQHPHIPANNWQGRFPPYITREAQIAGTVKRCLLRLLES